MVKEVDFESMRAADKMLDEQWLNAVLTANGLHTKRFVDMKTEADLQLWLDKLEEIRGC